MGLVAYAVLAPLAVDFLGTRPYHSVNAHTEYWTKDELVLQTTFFKNDACTIRAFNAIGIANGIPEYLTYRDLDGLPPLFDRDPGSQSLNIAVDISKRIYDTVEIRTRHQCIGYDSLINKTFYVAYYKLPTSTLHNP
jgi:hypothetical protein